MKNIPENIIPAHYAREFPQKMTSLENGILLNTAAIPEGLISKQPWSDRSYFIPNAYALPVEPMTLVNVWGKISFETVEPVEQWVDVTKECTATIDTSNFEVMKAMVLLQHEGRNVAIFGIESGDQCLFDKRNYRIVKVTKSFDCGWWFRVEKKVS